jgi:hypothetical protein
MATSVIISWTMITSVPVDRSAGRGGSVTVGVERRGGKEEHLVILLLTGLVQTSVFLPKAIHSFRYGNNRIDTLITPMEAQTTKPR